MGTYTLKRFSANQILNTRFSGFIKNRRYDQDISRLGRFSVRRELGGANNSLNSELNKLRSELNNARLGYGDL